MPILRMTDLDLRGKRVLIREDLNVPVQNAMRCRAMRASARRCRRSNTRKEAGARVLVMSHLGRPEEGVYDEEFSLAPRREAPVRAARLQSALREELVGRRRGGAGRGSSCSRTFVSTRARKKDKEDLARRWPRCATICMMDASAPRIARKRARTALHDSRRWLVPVRC